MVNDDNPTESGLNSRRRRPFLKTIGAGIAGISLAGCSEGGGQSSGSKGLPDTIKFGATMPLSGGWKAVSPWYVNAWELFKERASPVTLGGEEFEIEVEVLDDQNDPNQTLSNTRELLNDKGVDILLGTYGNENIMAVAQVAKQKDKFTFNTGAAGIAPAKRYGGSDGHMVTLTGPGTLYTSSTVEVLSNQSPSPSKLGIVTPDASVYHDMAKGTKSKADELGIDYMEEVIALDAEDFSSVVQRFDDNGVDVYMNLGGYNHGVPMVTALRRLDISPKAIYFGYEVQNPEMENSLGEDGDYLLGMNWYHEDLDLEVTAGSPWDTTQEFIQDVNSSDIMDSPIDYHQTWAATSMELPLTALQDVNWDETSFETAMSRDYLYPKILDQSGNDTLEGPLKFNDITLNEGLIPFVYQLQDGLTPKIVGPGDWGRTDIKGYPHPGWN